MKHFPSAPLRSVGATLLALLLFTATLSAGPQNFGPLVGPQIGDDTTKTEQKVLRALVGYQGTTRVSSTAYESSRVLLTGGGNLVSLIGYNSGTGGFIQLYDSTTVPADGAVPVAFFAVPGTGNFSLDVSVLGMPFVNGVAVVYSTTGPTKTEGTPSVFFTAITK